MLLVLAIACLLPCGLGLLAQREHKPSAWCSSSKEQCGVFLIGLLMLKKLTASPPQSFAVFNADRGGGRKVGMTQECEPAPARSESNPELLPGEHGRMMETCATLLSGDCWWSV